MSAHENGVMNSSSSSSYDHPLDLQPDAADDNGTVYKPRKVTSANANANTSAETRANDDSALNSQTAKNGWSNLSLRDETVCDTLRWALDALQHPAIAAADWLARDIDPNQPSATAMLSNPQITLAQVRQAKTVFKTMRIVGEKSADRRVGARMYTAAIAAGLVRHGKMVSTQSEAALKRGFQALLDDRRMPMPLRDLAGMALCALDERKRGSK